MKHKRLYVSEDQAKLPFGARGGAESWLKSFSLERKVLLVLGTLCGGSMALYVILITLSVFHVVAGQELARENRELTQDISLIEREYLSRSTTMTEEYARTLGFVTPRERLFIERGTLTLSTDLSNAR